MSRRIPYHWNHRLQWFHPPIQQLQNGRIVPAPRGDFADPEVGLEPETWAMELGFLLDQIWSRRVGQAVLISIRNRTTIYSSADINQADPDPYEDRPDAEITNEALEETHTRAAVLGQGSNARIWVNINRPVERSQGVIFGTPLAGLFHELIHAMNITWGNYQGRAVRSDTGLGGRAPTPEEECAWVIENMYRSESNMPLRADYLDSATLPSSSTSTGHPGIEAAVVARYRARIPMFTSRLSRIDRRTCLYNPFRRRA